MADGRSPKHWLLFALSLVFALSGCARTESGPDVAISDSPLPPTSAVDAPITETAEPLAVAEASLTGEVRLPGWGFEELPIHIAEHPAWDVAVDFVIEEQAARRGLVATTRTSYNPTAEFAIVQDGVSSADFALGWWRYESSLATEFKMLAIDAGEGCVMPTTRSIQSGDYPIVRRGWLYVVQSRLDENPVLEDFVEFYVENLDEAAGAVGLIPFETR